MLWYLDCMGKLRSIAFDAVIGIGGTGAQPEEQGISYKVTWIGIGARKTKPDPKIFSIWSPSTPGCLPGGTWR